MMISRLYTQPMTRFGQQEDQAAAKALRAIQLRGRDNIQKLQEMLAEGYGKQALSDEFAINVREMYSLSPLELAQGIATAARLNAMQPNGLATAKADMKAFETILLDRLETMPFLSEKRAAQVVNKVQTLDGSRSRVSPSYEELNHPQQLREVLAVLKGIKGYTIPETIQRTIRDLLAESARKDGNSGDLFL